MQPRPGQRPPPALPAQRSGSWPPGRQGTQPAGHGRRAPRWARLALIAGVLLMVLSGGTLVGARLLIARATSNITQTNLIQNDSGAGAQVVGNDISGPINILLVGIDARPTGSRQDSVLADTIVILHVPASHDQAYLVSIPRDWRVRIPAYQRTGAGAETEKINKAFSNGYRGGGTELEKRARGVDLLAKTLHQLTDITFNGAALIDFAGFEAVVNKLGGVEMCVDQRATSIHLAEDSEGRLRKVWYDENNGIQGLRPDEHAYVHEKGCRRMPATLALDYARIRKGLDNGDYDRQRHQQQLIKAIAREATGRGMMVNLPKLLNVIDSAGKAFVLDTQGVPIADFLFTLRGVAANDLVTIKTNEGSFNSLRIGGRDFERLSDQSMDMLAAMSQGTLPEFLLSHPEFVAIAE